MFEELLKEKLKGDFCNLKLLSAVYKKQADSLFVVLQYPDSVVLDENLKSKIKSAVCELTEKYCQNVKVSLKKGFLDLDYIDHKTKEEIKNSFPLVSVFAEKHIDVCKNKDNITISFEVEEGLCDYVHNKKVKETLDDTLGALFGMPVDTKITFCAAQEVVDDVPEFAPVVVDDGPQRFIKVFNTQTLVGDEIEDKPLYISDIKHESESVCVCGAIGYIQIKEFTTKTGKTRHLAKFGLKDPTGNISCIMFLSEANLPKVEKLVVGTEILVAGKAIVSKFDSGIEVEAKQISLCEIEKNFVEKVKFKPEPEKYKVTFPEKIEYIEQISLFETNRKVSDYLANHDIVVFDLETTGLNFLDSEIIEIGAIKIKKGGVISERFATYVKPKSKIPKEITELTGITDEDVKNGSSLEDALADFYKFTRNATLVGHNVGFDYGFINYYGKKVGYDFEGNELQDTYALASRYVRGLKNYKLKTVAEYFGVSLKNAHRAYHDAYATAQVYLKLHIMSRNFSNFSKKN